LFGGRTERGAGVVDFLHRKKQDERKAMNVSAKGGKEKENLL